MSVSTNFSFRKTAINQGFTTILAVLIMLAITSTIIISLQLMGLNNFQVSTSQQNSLLAKAYAEACTETALGNLKPVSYVGWVNGSTFNLKNTHTSNTADTIFDFGNNSNIPLAGDWDGDLKTTIGRFNNANNTWFLKNTNTGGNADINFIFAPVLPRRASALPITGDWDGDLTFTPGFFINATPAGFQLKNSNTTGSADITFNFGNPNDLPITGDWDGNGTVTIGVFRPSTNTFYLKNSNTTGSADITFNFGNPNDLPITGDWDGNGTVTIGVFRPSTNTFYLKNSNTTGPEDISLNILQTNIIPITGAWSESQPNTLTFPPGSCSTNIQKTNAQNFTLTITGISGSHSKTIIVNTSQIKPEIIIGSWQD